MIKLNNDDYILESSKIHNNKYDYSLVNYLGANKKVKIICLEHGEFEQIARDHKRGQGCPTCAKDSKYEKTRLSNSELLNRFNKKYNNKYDYNLDDYKNLKSYIKIICKIHGEFEQRADVHLNGEGCKACYLKTRGDNQKYTNDSLINRFKEIHGDKYDYSSVEYDNLYDKIKIICPIHSEFEQVVMSHLHGGNCIKCNPSTSKGELNLLEFIKTLNVKVISNDTKILDGKELDVYIPLHNLAIEYDGLYWHSDKYLNKSYHLNKTEQCEAKGIKLIHIFEDEWIYKQDIVKSRIKNILGITENKIYGRKCEVKIISSKDSKVFLENNHIQGHTVSKINIGLYYNNELVSIMTFGSRKILNKNTDWELIRFCNKLDTTVIGGASKLLKYFIKNYQPKEIISYADRRWSQGNLYNQLGFNFISKTEPNWFIVKSGRREHRLKYQKHKLVNQGYDKSKSATQILNDNNLYRIYDCGNLKYSIQLSV